MPPYHFITRQLSDSKMDTRCGLVGRDLHASGFSLSTSSRSGHPIYPLDTSATSKYQPPSCDTASDSPEGINISPQGTWKPVASDHPTANIEVLDLSGRYGYNPNNKAKSKLTQKNAMKEGFKPSGTMPSELPELVRTIHEISSDDDNDSATASDSSPLRSKRPRMTAAKNPTNPRRSVLEELRAAAGRSALPVLHPSSAMKPKTHKRGLSADRIFPYPTSQTCLPPNSSDSSHTELGTDAVNQPAVNDTGSVGANQASSANMDLIHIHQASANRMMPTASGMTIDDDHVPSEAQIAQRKPARGWLEQHHAHGFNPNVRPSPPFPSTQVSSNNPVEITSAVSPNALARTTIRIYYPQTRMSTPVYIPIKLRSVPTLASLFATVDTICHSEPRNEQGVSFARNRQNYAQHIFLRIRFDGDDEKAKGIMVVRKGVDASWECFLEEVGERMDVLTKGGKGELGIGVELGL